MSLPRPGPGPPHPILPIRFLRPPTPSHHALWLVEHHFGAGWFVANGGSVCSTWRIGRVGLEAVRAFSQLRGLSGLLWSVITPSAREQLRTSTRQLQPVRYSEFLSRGMTIDCFTIRMDQKSTSMLRRGLQMSSSSSPTSTILRSSSSSTTSSSFLIDDILVQRPKVRKKGVLVQSNVFVFT